VRSVPRPIQDISPWNTGSLDKVTSTVRGIHYRLFNAFPAIVVKEGKVTINGIHVVKTDIVCRNGVIHVIDAVLLPPADSK
jgi:uncharacterized surface protein with fasciclin (FAS1) repeats